MRRRSLKIFRSPLRPLKSLFALLREKGAELMGVGDLRGIVDGALITGVSVAVPVPRNIVLDLQTTPTREYYDAYHALNARLDEIVECGAEFLKKAGFQAWANTTKVVKKGRKLVYAPAP